MFVLAGDIACWSDSNEPQSKFSKYDSGKVLDFESALKSVVSLVASTGNFCYLGFCIELLLLIVKHMMFDNEKPIAFTQCMVWNKEGHKSFSLTALHMLLCK